MPTPSILAAPHRAWFALGLVSALLSMVWWVTWLALPVAPGIAVPPPVAPGHLHGVLMAQGMLGFFMFGFLTTTFPRWQDQPFIERSDWGPGVVAACLGYLLILGGALLGREMLVLGATVLALGHTLACLPLVRVYRAAGSDRVIHATMSLVGLTMGVVSLLVFAWGAAVQSADVTGAAAQMGIWMYLLPIYATVGHRMIPFFSSRVIDGYQKVRPVAPLVIVVAAGAGHVALELAGLPQWRWIADAAGAGASAWLAIAWKPWLCLRPALLGTLHLGFAWMPIAMALSATQSLVLLLTGELWLARGPVHALTIGCFGTLLIAMVSRVSLGHSGRPLVMGRATQALVLGMQGIALVRIAAEIPGLGGWKASLAAGVLWLGLVTWWGFIYGPMYWKPRADGRPG